ncbi:HAD family hydrolase [Clostridium ihumii]|uniref:HAD family hydrolase n=1 Tax=Clostridium ihumii TaxID=1470356 RepID=UPI0006865243|nr:HAD family hydrolase [Clostridium ihumii]
MRMGDVKVIYFDMGNTLIDFHKGRSDEEKDKLGIKLLTEYLSTMNSKITYKDVENKFYVKWNKAFEMRKKTYLEYPIEEYLNSFLNDYEINLSLKQCVEAIKIFYKPYIDDVVTYDNTKEVLKCIRNRGYKIGVISNTAYYDEIMKECFKKLGLYEFIDVFIFSYSLKLGKPKKEIFYKALEKMNITPKEAIMVGDSLKNDMEPAIKVGMKAIWLNIKNKEKEVLNEPYKEVKDLDEILIYI